MLSLDKAAMAVVKAKFPRKILILTKIICHRNFGNEFAFTHSKHYLYYLARSPLSQIIDNETLQQN